MEEAAQILEIETFIPLLLQVILCTAENCHFLKFVSLNYGKNIITHFMKSCCETV